MEQFYNEATKHCKEEEECQSPEGLGPTENSYDLTGFIFENEPQMPLFTFPTSNNQNNEHSLIDESNIQSNNVGITSVYPQGPATTSTNFTQLKLENIDLASITQTSLAAGSEDTLDLKPDSKLNSRRRKMSDSSTDVPEYRNKRDRNNIAVRKSREKAKEQQKLAKDRVDSLRQENKLLESKVAQLQSELQLCRNMFIKTGAQVPEALEKALKDI